MRDAIIKNMRSQRKLAGVQQALRHLGCTYTEISRIVSNTNKYRGNVQCICTGKSNAKDWIERSKEEREYLLKIACSLIYPDIQ